MAGGINSESRLQELISSSLGSVADLTRYIAEEDEETAAIKTANPNKPAREAIVEASSALLEAATDIFLSVAGPKKYLETLSYEVSG